MIVLEGSCHTLENSLMARSKQFQDHRELGKFRASFISIEGNFEHLDEFGNFKDCHTSTTKDIFTTQGRFENLDRGRAKVFEMMQK